MSQVTQMDVIKAQIEYAANQGTSNKDITRNILQEWRGSETIKDMQEAEMYYKVKNTNIDNKTRNYKDEEGKIILNENLSNTKNKTAQYRKSVNQKYNFALAKPFIISCDVKNYKEAWEAFLNDKVRAVIQRCGKNGINKGIGWLYVWIDNTGELNIVEVDPKTIYPAWNDEAHTELDALVRDYQIIQYENLTPKTIYKVEYWDKSIVEKYIDYGLGQGSGDLAPDLGNGAYELSDEETIRATIQQSHLTNKDGSGQGWEKVPFIFFKGCSDELPLLNECKTDIDNYDMVKSKAIDSILDDIDAVLVVEGISAEMGELSRARKMVQNSRIVAIDPGGKAYFEKVNSDVTAIAQELELIKKDIQDNTSTVDLTTIKLGTNPSGQSMKSFYESLNEWANGYETEFRVFMNNLKYFFDKWLSWKGGFGTFEQLQQIKITFTLDRDMMINESEILEGISKMNGILSQETLDEMNPWVENHEKEQQRRDEDAKKEQENQELYKFEKDLDNLDKNNKNTEKTTNDN